MRSTTARARAAVTGGLLAAALVLTGCSSENADQPTESPEESASSTGDEAAETPPAWDRDTLPAYDEESAIEVEGPVWKATALEDRLVAFTGGTLRGLGMPDLAETWSFTPEKGALVDMWVTPDGTSGYAVSLVSATRDGTSVGSDRVTVHEFSPESGEVLEERTWQRRRTAADDPEAVLTVRVRAVLDDRVVLEAFTAADEPHATAVLDLAGTTKPWTAQDATPLGAGAGTVAVHRTTTVPPTVQGLDLDDGRRRWTALNATSQLSVVGSTDQRLVVARTGGFGIKAVESVAFESGRTRPAVSVDATQWGCSQADASTAVCQLPDKRLLAWDLTGNEQLWMLPTKHRIAPEVRMVRDGRVYGLVGADGWVVLDARSGEDLSSGVGRVPTAINDWGGLFQRDGRTVWLLSTGEPAEPLETESSEPTESDSESASPGPDEEPSESPSESEDSSE